MDSARNAPFVIKICGITNTDDATAAAEAGATAVGLNFYTRSPRYISLQQAVEISSALSSSVVRVGIFVNPHWDDLVRTAAAVPLDIVQVHGQVHGNLYGTASALRVWKAVSVDCHFSPDYIHFEHAEAYLLDTPSAAFGGSGQTFDWSRFGSGTGATGARFLVAGGLDSSNVAAAIAAIKPWGVDACSRLESRPGKKDVAKMRDFIGAASRAFQALGEESIAR